MKSLPNDRQLIYNSILKLPDQVKQAWKEVGEINLPSTFSRIDKIVISGMGGSALGGRVLDSLLEERIRVPIEVSTKQTIPAYCDASTLVILSSYSGNTEETLDVANKALLKRANVFIITTGGKLKQLMLEENLYGYIFKPINNPSGQPRMGLGYSISATISVLAKLNLVHFSHEEIQKAVETMNQTIKLCQQEISEPSNPAKLIATKLKHKLPVIIASEHLIGCAHAFKNQLNENAKTFSCLFDLPELNHHLMEGLCNPAEVKTYLQFLFLTSSLYSDFVTRRYPLTMEVVNKNEVGAISYQLTAPTKIDQIFEMLVLGSFISYYLAETYHLNPLPIPWVDYFKEHL